NGEENRQKLKMLLVVMVLIIFILLAYQGPYKIIENLVKISLGQNQNTDNVIDKLLFVYGIVSLIWNLYIRPLWKGDFLAATIITTGDMIRGSWAEFKSNLKKKLSERKKEYAKVEIVEQQRLQEHLKKIRQRLADVLMLFLGAGSIVFTPICAALVFGWFRIFYITSRKTFKYEVYILVCAFVVLCAINGVMPFVLDFTPFYATIQSAYFWTYISTFSGLLIGAVIYLRKYLGPILEKRKVQQIKSLKEEKADLEKQKADLEKQKKQMAKENKNLKKQSEKSKKN
ncbi:MAG: hypothetical protein GYA24_16135, partial [Candidatus Lokiarchaeota archaeon]|nr:hypothetical protein [Candidatus Lokiarchaeota archaeon]